MFSWLAVLCLLALSLAQDVPPICDEKYEVDLSKKNIWNWPKRVSTGFICYEFKYSQYAYASVHVDFTLIGDQDGLVIDNNYDYYNGQYVYGFMPYNDNKTYQSLGPLTITVPPTRMMLGLQKLYGSKMKIAQLQVEVTTFNPNKTAADTCQPSANETCGFDYSLFKEDSTYTAFGNKKHKVHILSAEKTLPVLVYDSDFFYQGPLGYTDKFDSSTIYLYCLKGNGSSNESVTFAEDDYEPPLTTHPTFPTNPSTISPTVTTTDKVTEAPPLTTGNNNNGQPTTVSKPLTTPKMGSRLPVHFAVIIGLVYLLPTV